MIPYSYRADPAVPAFDDSRPLYVFDGECVLCSRGAAWLMRHDPAGRVRFTSAQGALGRALYAHYGLPVDDSAAPLAPASCPPVSTTKELAIALICSAM